MTSILRRFTFWLALGGLVSLGLFIRANTHVPPIPEPLSKPPEKPFARSIGASGIVEALRENTAIGVPFAGLASRVPVQVWQKVRAGEVLLELDARDHQARRPGLQADLLLREAEWQRALHRQERAAAIGAGPALSQEELQTRTDDLQVAKAAVEKARAALEEWEKQLELHQVTAPIDGTILQVNVRKGEYITPGSATPPLLLGDIESLQVRVDVDEQMAARIREGVQAVAYRKGQTEVPIPLSFVRIEPFIVPKKSLTGASTERVDTRVLPVIFSFANDPSQRTYVGQQMDVFIEE